MAVSRSTWRRGGAWWRRSKDPTKKTEARGLAHGYRSGLEQKNGDFLKSRGVVVKFESLKIPYVVPESRRKYTPDFPLPNGIIVETKGKLEPEDRAKHLFIKSQWPELDIRFVFQRPSDPIYKGSPTSYGDWCNKYGFKWAIKLIPEAWLLEKGPAKKPAEVLGL